MPPRMTVSQATTAATTNSTPPEGWIFKRPALQGVSCKIQTNSREDVMIDIYDVLDAKRADCLEKFRRTCFGKFLRLNRKISRSLAVIQEVMSYQVVKVQDAQYSIQELNFFINGKFLTFGRKEFALIIGLLFGAIRVIDDCFDGPRKEKSLWVRKFNGEEVNVSHLLDCFNNESWSDDHADYIKVAKILVVYYLLNGTSDTWKVQSWIWRLVENEEAWECYPWGSHSYQQLIYNLNGIKT